MLISLASLCGSPGVSTAALALSWTWPRHAMVAECDPAGGRGLAVFDPNGALGRRGMFEAMLAARTAPMRQAVWRQAITLPDGTGTHFLLPGAHSRREAESLQWQRLAPVFRELDPMDVLADCGRLRSRGTPHAVLATSDLTVLLVRNDRHSLRAVVSSMDIVREELGLVGVADDGLVIVMVGTAHGFPLSEVRSQVAVPVLSELSWHPATAAAFTEIFNPSSKFEASPLLARARELAGEVGRRALARARRIQRTVRVETAARAGRVRPHREPVPAHQLAPIPRPPVVQGGARVV
ncbi:hypothetical protein [Amycolatopsis sp. NPDC059657]|uniref:hypothetical protein n=1 Tax=Amycolatopsis sp. NPDC059657 TaxID=3346899 RepID=UPI0036727535